MKKVFFSCMLLVISFTAYNQEKALVHSLLLKPKAGMKLQLESSLKAHNEKFHSGDNKVFVFEIISGEKMGTLQVAWPPTSWADMDNVKPDPAHEQDVQTTMGPYVEVNEGMIYSRRVDSLTHGDNDWKIGKTQVTIWHIKRGKLDEWLARLMKYKLAFDKSNDPRNYTIYSKLLAGSDAQVILISRFKNGWKELESGYYPPLKDVITKAYSAEEWEIQQKAFLDCVERVETYLRVFRPDLSSK